tara:strand:- start:428 stop:652 length:225 start_codon:yes stop_codon:yes gene_type:complete
MKKNEWIVLAKYLWSVSKVKPKMKDNIREIIRVLNENNELIIDDNEKTSPTNGSNLQPNADNTSEPTYKGNGEF